MNAALERSDTGTPSFELNRGLDTNGMRERYRQGGLVRVPEVLETLGALRLYKHLSQEVDWTTFVIADGQLYAGPAIRKDDPAETAAAALERAHAGLQNGFASVFDANRLFASDVPDGVELATEVDTSVLADFGAFANTPAFLDLCRAVTGETDIVRADIQARRLRKGQFVGCHSVLPYSRRHGRRLARFELNLTPEWQPEWGGLLAVMANADSIAQSCIPSFNLLDISSHVREQWISAVTPFAEADRLVVAGWLYGA